MVQLINKKGHAPKNSDFKKAEMICSVSTTLLSLTLLLNESHEVIAKIKKTLKNTSFAPSPA